MLTQADHSFVLELAWMQSGGVIESKNQVAQEKVLACFLSETAEVAIKQCMTHLEARLVSDVGDANTASNCTDISAAIGMHKKIQRGFSLAAYFKDAGAFWQAVYGCMPYFVRVHTTELGKTRKKCTFGAQATSY